MTVTVQDWISQIAKARVSLIRLMCNYSSENKTCAQRENYSFTGTGKATEGAQGWGHVLPNTCQ